jgi:PIN domain nuclease of toxin-antitoxin system
MPEYNNIQPWESAGRKSSAKIIAGYAALTVFCAFVVYYTIMALMSPARKIAAINSEFGYKAAENETVDPRLFSDSSFISLNRDKAWYQARIAMAETDSISLSLNMADSTATLEINGVAVHTAEMTWMRLSKVFRKADEYAITSMLSTPFTINTDFASIKKEPVMLKVAPKDTSEYKPDILPDTSNTEPVNYMLEMTNGFRLYVYQADEEEKGGFNRFFFDMADRFRNSLDITRSILLLKVPEYHPAIRIKLPKADARSIYRGLPRQGQIAVYR